MKVLRSKSLDIPLSICDDRVFLDTTTTTTCYFAVKIRRNEQFCCLDNMCKIIEIFASGVYSGQCLSIKLSKG